MADQLLLITGVCDSVQYPVIVLVDVSQVWHQSRLDPEILKLLQLHANTPSILVLNKVP